MCVCVNYFLHYSSYSFILSDYVTQFIGFLLRTTMCGLVTEQQKFDDEVVWELEDEFQHEFGKNRNDNTRPNDHIAMGNI